MIGLLGRNAIWISTASIENIVNKELDEAAIFFKEKDMEIHHAVLDIQKDEIHHQKIASEHADFNYPIAEMIAKFAQQCAYLAKFLAIHLKISLPSKKEFASYRLKPSKSRRLILSRSAFVLLNLQRH